MLAEKCKLYFLFCNNTAQLSSHPQLLLCQTFTQHQQCPHCYAHIPCDAKYDMAVPLLFSNRKQPDSGHATACAAAAANHMRYNASTPLILSNGNRPVVMSHLVLLLLLLLPLTCCYALLRYYHPHPPQRAVKSERTFEGISLDTPGQSSRQVLQMSRFQLCSTCYQRESSPSSGMLLLHPGQPGIILDFSFN